MTKLKMVGWALVAFMSVATYNWATKTWDDMQSHARRERARADEVARVAKLTPEQRQGEAEQAEIRRVAAAKQAAEAAAAAKKAAEVDAAEKKADERRGILVFAAVSTIIKRARDPHSVTVYDARYTEGKKAEGACVNYGARNGFGGMNREYMVATEVGGQVIFKFNDPAAWNRTCVGMGWDKMYIARQTTKKLLALM